MAAGWTYGWILSRSSKASTGEALRTMFRAEAVKVLVDPEGSEYFLLENRRRKGFDAGGQHWYLDPNRRLARWAEGACADRAAASNPMGIAGSSQNRPCRFLQ